MEEVVAGVGGLAGEIELRGQEPLAGRLHLDVIVPGAAGIGSRLDGAEAIAALLVGEDVAAIAEATIVIGAVVVRVIGPKYCGIAPKDNIALSRPASELPATNAAGQGLGSFSVHRHHRQAADANVIRGRRAAQLSASLLLPVTRCGRGFPGTA
jgi:hypothetical protein